MKYSLAFAVLFFASFAYADNVRYDSPARAINANVAVCSSPANGLPCTNYATTYNSAGASCATSAPTTTGVAGSVCSATTDSQGHVGFWAAAGTYDYTVCAGNSCQGPFTVTLNIGTDSGPINSATSGGGFLSNCILGIASGVQFSGTIVAVNNEVRYFRCFLPAAFTVGHASTIISTNPAGTAAAGLYNCTAPYAAIVRFGFDSSTTGTKTNSQTPTLVPRGCVIFAYTASSATMTPHTYTGNSAGEINGVTDNIGTASGLVSAGILPASLGTLTGSTSVPPYVMTTFFEY